MTDLDALRAAILRDPADDTVRLAFADALDERAQPGDALYAEFIRLQIEHENGQYLADWSLKRPLRISELLGNPEMRRAAFYDDELGTLFKSLGGGMASVPRESWLDPVWSVASDYWKGTAQRAPIWVDITRGFVNSVRCEEESWIRHHKRIMAFQPVQLVTIVVGPCDMCYHWSSLYPNTQFFFQIVPSANIVHIQGDTVAAHRLEAMQRPYVVPD